MLFKALDTKKVPANCAETDAVKYYISSFQKAMDWDTARPIVDTAEEKHILPAIGQDLYDVLNAHYAAYPATALPTKAGLLIRKLQKAIAYFTHHVAIQELITSTGDLGPVETQDSTGTAVIPRQWTVRTALRHSFTTGHEKLQLALIYLESQADDAEFSSWKTSQAFTDAHRYFIRGPQDLAQLMPTDMPYVVWQQLKPYMDQAERRYILPVLGQEFYDEMKTAIADNDLSAIQTECLNQIQATLINWVKIHAIPHLRLAFSENGLLEVQGDTDGVLSFQRPVRPDPTTSLWLSLNDAGQWLLVALRTWLQQNADSLPTYQNSDAYTAQTPFHGGSFTDEDDNPYTTYAFG